MVAVLRYKHEGAANGCTFIGGNIQRKAEDSADRCRVIDMGKLRAGADAEIQPPGDAMPIQSLQDMRVNAKAGNGKIKALVAITQRHLIFRIEDTVISELYRFFAAAYK